MPFPTPGVLCSCTSAGFCVACVAVRDQDGDRLLQGQHIAHLRVGGERIEKALFDRAGVAEHVVDAVGKKLLDDGETSGFPVIALPTIAAQAVFQYLDHQFADQLRILGGATRQERR